MSKLLWEVKIVLCDLCKKNEMKKPIEIERGKWIGVCSECNPKEKEQKNENLFG